MSLSESKLVTELRKIMDPSFEDFIPFGTVEDASDESGITDVRNTMRQRWSSAYDAYASSAEDLSGDSVLTKFPAKFLNSLTFAEPGTNETAALEFSTAWARYWTGGAFAIGKLVAGLGSPCPNVGLGTKLFAMEATSLVTVVNAFPLLAALVTEFSTVTESNKTRAENLAKIFHTATTTQISVVITGVDATTPTPLAVVNTYTVF